MVKRGIGAVVLAVIAALLLGWLLKDKSQERQDLVDMKMPTASEMNIPSLTDAVDKVSDSASSMIESTKEKVADAGNSVVSAATGTVDAVKNTVSDTANVAANTVTNNPDKKPGFSIRPPQQNETKEIVDNVDAGSSETITKTVESSAPSSNTEIVASTTKKANFTPQIVEEKKKPTIKKKEVTKKKVVTKKEVAKKAPAPKEVTSTPNASGKYSIQLLATSSQTRANKLADVMSSEGYKSFITQTHRDGKLLYRVRVGGYADRNLAITAQEGMKKRYQKNFFVQNSLVISK